MKYFIRSTLAALVAAPALLGAQSPAQTTRLAPRSMPSIATAPARANIAVPAVDTAIAQLEGFLQRYPNSPLRPNALFQLGELLVRRADERFAESQRSGGTSAGTDTAAARSDGAVRADYAPAIARYEELVRRYPNFQKVDAAAYTLGTLYSLTQRHPDAARMFEVVAARDSSPFLGEALFRLGDAQFEIAAKGRGDARRESFQRAAEAYRRAVTRTPAQGDIYFLSLYKLGWSHYNQATQANRAPYDSAVHVFGELVAAYDKLTPEQQARLGLRGEAIEYMAVAFTQVGGSEAATRYFEGRGGANYKQALLGRVANSLRDQGNLTAAVEAYEALQREAPTDSAALTAQREIIDIYQNRAIEPEQAQAARLALVEKFGPGSAWAQANPGMAAAASQAREDALRQSGQYLLASAQKGGQQGRYAEAASLYQRYLAEYASSDSAQAVSAYYAVALEGQGNYLEAGTQYMRAAYDFSSRTDSASVRLAQQSGQNSIIAFDSAVVKNKGDRAAQDAMFASVDRFVAAFPQSEQAKKALIQKGKRASETQRWDVLASTFRLYAERYPTDAYTPTAQKLVGDALYKQGQFAEAQAQWELAQGVASQGGRTALADTIARLRSGAANDFADTLIKQGQYRRAAEEVYVALADKNPQGEKAPEALRNAIETYMIVVDSGAAKNMSADDIRQSRERAIELSQRLTTTYPNYRYRRQYLNLTARLLAESGKREEAVEALRALTADNAGTPVERKANLIRIAVALDSLGRKKEAADAYEQFANAYRTDKEAPNALYNAAVTYVEAGDSASAARVYGVFANRYPQDVRVSQARAVRVALLRASGDSATATAELSKLCVRPTADIKDECSARVGRAAYERGIALFETYQPLQLVISDVKQLTAAGLKRASARKQALLVQMRTEFGRAIRSGSPEYLAAGTYQLGLAQQEYGNFLKNVVLPEGLTEQEQAAGRNGAARQAEEFYVAARATWQALVEKAEQDEDLKKSDAARQYVDRAREALRNTGESQ